MARGGPWGDPPGTADGLIRLADDWLVPVDPLIGCLATEPGRETILSRREGDYGGNIDCGEITGGATVILPVDRPRRLALLR